VKFIGILEILGESRGLNTEEVLTNLILFWNLRVTTALYLVETDVFSNALTLFSKKTLAWSISNSYNLIKEDQMLWLGVEYQNFAKDIK